MDTLTALREQLDQVLIEAAADLEAREAAVAQSIEAATADAVRAAWHEAQRHEQARVLNLIDAQIAALNPVGSGAVVVLRTLKRMVGDG